jgi:hypothetical protein
MICLKEQQLSDKTRRSGGGQSDSVSLGTALIESGLTSYFPLAVLKLSWFLPNCPFFIHGCTELSCKPWCYPKLSRARYFTHFIRPKVFFCSVEQSDSHKLSWHGQWPSGLKVFSLPERFAGPSFCSQRHLQFDGW